jgi:hypothetical protein
MRRGTSGGILFHRAPEAAAALVRARQKSADDYKNVRVRFLKGLKAEAYFSTSNPAAA